VVRVRLVRRVSATELRGQLRRERLGRLGRLEQQLRIQLQLRLGELLVERWLGLRW